MLAIIKVKLVLFSLSRWPFVAINKSNDDRIYVRYHSEDYETRAIDDVNALEKGFNGLLGDAKQKTWQDASEIVSI